MSNSPEPGDPKSPQPDLEVDDNEVNESVNPETAAFAAEADTTGEGEAPESVSKAPLDPMHIDSNSTELQNDLTDLEPSIAAKKDATLREFLGKIDDYAPIIPDAVTNHYLTLAGLPPPPQTPPHLARLLALATQKFVADIAADAYQYARIRSSHTTSNTAAANPLSNIPGAPGAPPGGVPGAGAGAAAGAAAGIGGAAGGVGAAGKDGDKGKGAAVLGVQRPGYGGSGQGGGSQGRTVLTMEDLGMAVGEYGISVKRGEFYR